MSVPSDEKLRRGDWHYVDGHLGGNFMTVYGSITSVIEITSVDDENEIIKYKINKPELIFDDVYSLSTVVFEKGSKLKHIGFGTFAYQKSITTIDLPKDLETLSLYAFYECPINAFLLDAAIKTDITIVDLPEDDDNTSSGNTTSKTDKKTESKPATKTYPINSVPVIKSAASENAGTIELSWNETGAPGYIVYIAKEGTGSFVKCGTFTDTSATISSLGENGKLESGKTYLVRVIRSDYKGELWETLAKYTPVSVTVK